MVSPASAIDTAQTPLVRFVLAQPMCVGASSFCSSSAPSLPCPPTAGCSSSRLIGVTIHVTECPDQPASIDQGCTGIWALPDGSVGSGPIDGYAPWRGERVDVRGWATSTRATTQLSIWLVYPIAGLVALVGAVLTIVVIALRLRRRRPAEPRHGGARPSRRP